jgi:hypothetical protein
LRDARLRTNSGFKRFADADRGECCVVCSDQQREHAVVVSAWQDVGVPVSGGSPALTP